MPMKYLLPFLLFAALLFPPIIQEINALPVQSELIAKDRDHKHGGGRHHGSHHRHHGGRHHGWGNRSFSNWGYGNYYSPYATGSYYYPTYYPYGSYYYYYPNYYYPNVNSGYYYSIDPAYYYYWFR
jgi:hypothetical protein